MRRGDLYRVLHPNNDPKRSRVFVVISRPALINSKFSTVVCAPVYSVHDGLASQVIVGIEEGLKHESSIHCDELVSLPKSLLSNYIGMLPTPKLNELAYALKIALDL